MANYVDLNRMELAVGKQGPVEATLQRAYVQEWSAFGDSKRCLVHASLLQRNVEGMLFRRVVAMHVPRCLFSAAIVWSAYLQTLTSLTNFPPGLSLLVPQRFPELDLLGINFAHHWHDVLGFRKGTLCAIKGSTLCTLADMLRQISYWEVARKFSKILAPLIHEGTDDSMVPR